MDLTHKTFFLKMIVNLPTPKIKLFWKGKRSYDSPNSGSRILFVRMLLGRNLIYYSDGLEETCKKTEIPVPNELAFVRSLGYSLSVKSDSHQCHSRKKLNEAILDLKSFRQDVFRVQKVIEKAAEAAKNREHYCLKCEIYTPETGVAQNRIGERKWTWKARNEKKMKEWSRKAAALSATIIPETESLISQKAVHEFHCIVQ